MRKLIFIFFVLPFCLKSQGIVVGDTVSGNIIYKNFRDTVVPVIGNGVSTGDFDLDGDLINDVRFKITLNYSAGYSLFVHQILSLDNLEFVSIISPSGYLDTMALNTTIDNSSNWHTNNWANFFYEYNAAGNTTQYGVFKSLTGYVGFRKLSGTDTIYGWIYITNTSGIKIKSWAYQSNSSITTKIKELKQGGIIVFPNPATNTVHISNENKAFENSIIEITNFLGQAIIKQAYANEVDVSVLSTGIYTLKINTQGKQSFYSKFIKE